MWQQSVELRIQKYVRVGIEPAAPKLETSSSRRTSGGEIAMDLQHPDAATIEVPWRALFTCVGGGVLSLCAWTLSGVDLVLLAGMTGSAMLSCLAREPLPSQELRPAPRVRRSRRAGAIRGARVSQPRIGGPAPAPQGQLPPAARTDWRPTRPAGPSH